MAEPFSERLRNKANHIWQAQHCHPFVRGIADGTLSLERFKFWVRQDYVFLIDYARLLALAMARSPDLPTMTRFAKLVTATLDTEMSLHRAYAAEFGISSEELEGELPAPKTGAYTNFLLRVAALGDFAGLVAALLPCLWGFSEIGRRLARQPRPADPRYAKWIDMYASAEFAELAEWCRGLLDRLCERLPECDLQKVEDAFLTSSRHEWQFWEMAWKMEPWPI
jgi:thiaminase (transcriptional activator TenA)